MYRIKIIVCCLLLMSLQANAQKEDYTWIVGYGEWLNPGVPDTSFNKHFGNSIIDFNKTPLEITRYWYSANLNRDIALICNNKGILKLYANGFRLYNGDKELIENGDSLTPSYMYDVIDTTVKEIGYPVPQFGLILNTPGDTNRYYYFHTYIDTHPHKDTLFYAYSMLYSEVWMNANNGKGKVSFKNKTLLNFPITGQLTAYRHANNRDWWMIVNRSSSNYFTRILLDSSGPQILAKEQSIGDVISAVLPGGLTFSPNGKKYILLNFDSGLHIYDFDRCTGLLSHPVKIDIPEIRDSSLWALGLSVSPNSRFAYVSATNRIYQYDLEARDIGNSKIEVARYDGFLDLDCPTCTTGLPTGMMASALAPDGKIYIGTGNSTRYFHVIHQPNEKGLACNVEQHGILSKTYNGGVPNVPHFRTQAVPCYGVGIEELAETEIKIYPNPTNDIMMLFTTQEYHVNDILVTDALGKQMKIPIEQTNTTNFNIKTAQLESGVYYLSIQHEDKTIKRIPFYVSH